MTQVGHSITGAALGVLCLPQKASTIQAVTQVVAFVLLANIPDVEAQVEVLFRPDESLVTADADTRAFRKRHLAWLSSWLVGIH